MARISRAVLMFWTAALLTGFVVHNADASDKWVWGFKGGYNNSSFSGDPVSAWLSGSGFDVTGAVQDSRNGGQAGMFVRRQMSPKFALQLDGVLSRLGGKGTVYGTALIPSDSPGAPPQPATIDGTLDLYLDYVQLPLLAQLTMPASDGAGFIAYAGLYLGLLVDAGGRISGEGVVDLPDDSTRKQTFDEVYDIRSKVTDTDVGGTVGAMMEWYRDHARWQLEARYSFSMTTIDNSGEASTGNKSFSLILGFGWPSGRAE